MNFFKSLFKKIPFVGRKPVDKEVHEIHAKYVIIKGRKIRVK
jgi:hypothetical protein